MAQAPIITFKAGKCEYNTSVTPPKVVPQPTPGYLYLFEDDLVHLCWRPRSAPSTQPELDLIMLPGDGSFAPYQRVPPSSDAKNPTNGRIFVLKFASSSNRHFFWLQAKSQHHQGDASHFSPRDIKLGEIVHKLIQGDEINVQEEVSNLNGQQQGGDGDGDAEMRDVAPEGQGDEAEKQGDPFIGNPENEGGQSRDGGADGGRAASTSQAQTDAAKAVQDFLKSMQGSQALKTSQISVQSKPFTTLPKLLPPIDTIPFIDSATEDIVDNLLRQLPPVLLLLSQEINDGSLADPSPEVAEAAMEALSLNQKKDILRKVLRSPQFTQSLASLTIALRDGGLPSIGDALHIPIKNGGVIQHGTVPLGGGEAVEAFLEGVKASVQTKEKQEEEEEGQMDVS